MRLLHNVEELLYLTLISFDYAMFAVCAILFFVSLGLSEGFITTCGKNEFPCDDGTCIEMLVWCDGIENCPDDSDELYCTKRFTNIENPNRCKVNYFLCKDGPCIPVVGRCDGYASCNDKSDEEDCDRSMLETTEYSFLNETTHVTNEKDSRPVKSSLPLKFSNQDLNYDVKINNRSWIAHKDKSTICSESEFPCDDGTCIQKSDWCDSRENCPDDSDELYCARKFNNIADPNRCKENYFLCNDGPCIPLVGRCDGLASCLDHSDEENCGITLPIHLKGTSIERTEFQSTNLTKQSTEALTTSSWQLETSSETLNVLSKRKVNYDMMHNDQSERVKGVKATEQDLTKGFKQVDPHYYANKKLNAETWLLSIRDNEYGWSDETARAITALYLSNPDLLKKKENILMSKQLHLKLSVLLVRNQTEVLSLTELALYINALYATCDDPRNFHGQNLVDILRHRTSAIQKSDKYVSPLVYLTLCISNSTTDTDLKKMQRLFSGFNGAHKQMNIDTKALATLAATCMSSIPEHSSLNLGKTFAKMLYNRVTEQGMPENIYELALVSQALNEAKISQNLWNRSVAMNMMSKMQQPNGSFGDILSTYYALPVFSGKSIASLAKHCYTENGLIPLDILMNGKEEKQFVTYSLYFGDPMQVSQTLRIRVGKSSSFLDIMRIAETTNAMYRFKCDMARSKPFVYSIGGFPNDAEKGMYWNLHLQRNSTRPVPYDADIRSYVPEANDHVIFWMKLF